MKLLLRSFMVIVLASPAWAGYVNPAARSQTPKKLPAHAKPAPAVVLSTPTAIAPQATAAAERAVESEIVNQVAPKNVPFANVLDDVVLENTLAPLANQAAAMDPPATLRSVVKNEMGKIGGLNIAVLGGVQTLAITGHIWTSAALALCVKADPSRWSYELGSAIPKDTDLDFRSITVVNGNVTTIGRIRSLYEIHAIADYALRDAPGTLVVPDVGFGASMMHIKSQVEQASNAASYDEHYAFCPLLTVGVTFFPDRFISARADVSYVGYGNAVTGRGQTFDLGISGWMIREMLQIRL